MQVVGAALGGGGDVAGLPELRRAAHALHLDFGNVFRRREGVVERLVPGHIGGGNAVHAEVRLRLQAALNGEIAALVRLHAGENFQQIIRAVAVPRGPVVGGRLVISRLLYVEETVSVSVVMTPTLSPLTSTCWVISPTTSAAFTRNSRALRVPGRQPAWS